MDIAENLKLIRENITEAAISCGRDPRDIDLVAVTKYVPAERIRLALESGITNIGENKVQELMSKIEFLDKFGVGIHFIGQLQTNKVKYVIGKVDVIQSVDREQLAEEINRQAAKLELVQDVFIEVNIGNELQKAGTAPDRLLELLDVISEMKHVSVKGLMCVPPATDEETARFYFGKMRVLFDEARRRNDNIRNLSMGMSNDYRSAILEGATMVRIGTGIFGRRQ
jgi:pyridoxal phosphate enzyme (YggS family)